jgi:hypothetical protein
MFDDYEVQIQIDEMENPYDSMDEWQHMDAGSYLQDLLEWEEERKQIPFEDMNDFFDYED